MRKVFSFLALAATSLLLTQSCNKMSMRDKPVTTTQTVNASISENAGYSYTLPAASTGSVSQITTSALHSSASAITTDANGNNVYNYTPAVNYSGTDVVVITTKTEEQHGGCHGGPGGMGNHVGNGSNHDDDDNTTITTINLTVTPANQAISKPANPAISKSQSSSAGSNY